MTRFYDNYLALFLDKEKYIEKCLSLIRFIGNPESTSLPHITLRLYKETNARRDFFENKQITYVNIIEPGSFNLIEEQPPYVVYVRCESEDLEEHVYKPDYPYSRLHITLYEGSDIEYARGLLNRLNQQEWHFKLSFKPQNLTSKKLGTKLSEPVYFRNIFSEILNDQQFHHFIYMHDINYKLKLVDIILFKMSNYLKEHEIHTDDVDSYYLNTIEDLKTNSTKFINQSETISWYKENKLNFTSFSIDDITSPITKRDPIHVTPPEYARDMAQCAINACIDNNIHKIDFGDSAIGTGSLFLALKFLVDDLNNSKKQYYKIKINSAIGIDIDQKIAEEAFLRCSKRGLTVIYGDAVSPEIKLSSLRNVMIVNPPFNRHEDIPYEYKLQLCNLVETQTGIKVTGEAGLYVYHLLILDKWLCNGGIAVWLLPTVFMQTKYGEAIRKYLLNKVQLISMHTYEDVIEQFDRTLISTTIITFKKQIPDDSREISISKGISLSELSFSATVNNEKLKETYDNWRCIFHMSTGESNQTHFSNATLKFEELFDIKRGLATGANSFFVMHKNKADKIGIPEFALKPLLPKARYINSSIIESDKNGFPLVSPQLVLIDCDRDEEYLKTTYPAFYEYLQTAKVVRTNMEKSIVNRTLVKSRRPWYKQEKREPAPFLLTYMGRAKKNLPPLYFIWNKSQALALNTYLLLYPKEWLRNLLDRNEDLYHVILIALNKSAEKVLVQQTRVYSGGLQKIEPGELKMLSIIDLPNEVISAYHSKQSK